MCEASTQALLASLRSLQTSEEYSDLKIFCSDGVFRVHKAVICPRSKYFATSCKWGMSEKPKEEITLEDDEPRLVRLMIDYFYQLDYDDKPQVKEVTTPTKATANGLKEPESPVGKKVEYFEGLGRTEEPQTEEVIAEDTQEEAMPEEAAIDNLPIATQVDLPSWRSAIRKGKKDKKKKKASFTWPESPPPEPASERMDVLHFDKSDNDLDNTELGINALMYALADKYGIDDLKELARSKFADAANNEHNWKSTSFPHVANLVCESTLKVDRGLRTVVVDTINEHRELLDYEEVQELLGSGNGLAPALLRTVLLEDFGHTILTEWQN